MRVFGTLTRTAKVHAILWRLRIYKAKRVVSTERNERWNSGIFVAVEPAYHLHSQNLI